MKMRIIKITSSMIGCLIAFAVQQAKADSFTYSLANGNAAISGYTGPYGSVLVDLTSSTTADITFTAATGFLIGDGGTAGVNVNAGSWTLGTITGSRVSSTYSDAGA